MPYGFWAAFAFLLGIPFALIMSHIMEAYLGTDTGYPNFIVMAWVLCAVVQFLTPYFRGIYKNLEGGSILFTVYAGFMYLIMDYGALIEDSSGQEMAMQAGWFLIMTFGSAIFLVVPFWIFEFFSKLKQNPEVRGWFGYGKGGAAQWSGTYFYNKLPAYGSIYLGSTLIKDTLIKQNVGIKYEDDAHHVTIASTGSGKSVTAIWPTIKRYKGPMVVLDPKGEHAAFSAESRDVSVILDPYEKSIKAAPDLAHMLEGYNPLAEIDIKAEGARALIQAISTACVIEEAKDIHFTDSARTVIEGLIVHVLAHFPPNECNLPKVADLLRGFDDDLRVSDPKAFDKIIADMTTNDAAGGLAMDAASILLTAGDRERGSILTTCFRSLKWVTDPPMRKHLTSARPDYAGQHLQRAVEGRGDYTVYIVLPFEYMSASSQIRWMRMLVNLINVHLFRNPRDKKGQNKLLLILDEFFKLGYMPSLEEGIVTARGAGMKYWILIQNIGQLIGLYGDNWETFLGSSNVQIFGGNDGQTAKWAAAALGGVRDNKSEQYPLMRPDEVRQFLGKDFPTQIVVPVNGPPMRLERLAFKPLKQYRGI